MRLKQTTTLSGEVRRTTEAAILFRWDADGDGSFVEEWFPRSALVDGDEVEKGDEDIIAHNWILERKGYA